MTITAFLQAATAQGAGSGLVHVPQPESGGAWFLATIVKMLLTFTLYMVGVDAHAAERKV